MRINNILAICSFFLFTIVIQASAEYPYPMGPKEYIEIHSYDPETRTYDIKLIKYPRQGPFITTPEEVCKGISALNLERVLRSPSSIVGNQYTTDRTILLLPPKLVENRRPANLRAKHTGIQTNKPSAE